MPAETYSPAQAPAFAIKDDAPRHEREREEQRREAQRLQAEAEGVRDEPRHEEPPREEPKHEEPRREEPRRDEPRREEPKIDSKALLESSGLVMIETDRSKAQFVPQLEEPQHLGRPRRDRPKPQLTEDELQQVETRK
jgi:hypothetical protein